PIQVCDGTGLGVTELVWRVPGGKTEVAIRLERVDGQLFAEGPSSGSARTGRWASDGTRFLLLSKQDSRILADTTVSVTAEGCD
ncbi:MAG: hypothetical protein AAGM22_32550, partial [Acidobacteriota bacterium]